VVGLAAATLAVGPLLSAESTGAGTWTHRRVELPLVPGCDAPGRWELDWKPRLDRLDLVGMGSYACQDVVVHAFVAGSRSDGDVASQREELFPNAWERLAVQKPYTFDGEHGRAE